MRNRSLQPAKKAIPTIRKAFEQFQKQNQLKNLSQGTPNCTSKQAATRSGFKSFWALRPLYDAEVRCTLFGRSEGQF